METDQISLQSWKSWVAPQADNITTYVVDLTDTDMPHNLSIWNVETQNNSLLSFSPPHPSILDFNNHSTLKKGYFRIVRGKDECGIESEGSAVSF